MLLSYAAMHSGQEKLFGKLIQHYSFQFVWLDLDFGKLPKSVEEFDPCQSPSANM